MTCESISCSRRNLEGYSYCRHHKCKKVWCQNQSQGRKLWCGDHICTYSSCNSENLGSSWGCKKHKCKLSNCSNVRNLRSIHCNGHMCSRKGCTRPQKGAAAVCEAHLCQMQGCSSACQDYPGSRACTYHVCQVDICTRPQKAPGRNFCGRHSCRWNHTPCPENKTGGSAFCVNHKCPSRGCLNCCQAVGAYCVSCRCYYPDCPNVRSRGMDCCSDHTCGSKGCSQPLLDASDYIFCNSHTCLWSADGYRCGSYVETGASCCSIHTCSETNCHSACFDQGRYCVNHTRSQDYCPNWPDSTSETSYQERGMEAPMPLVTTKAPRRMQSTQLEMSQAYGRGYLEGVAHGLNIDPQDQEEARRLFGNLNIYRPQDQNPDRRVMEDLVNGAIKRGGRKGAKNIQDGEEQGGGDGH